jgi:leader peptidase HopD
MMTFAFFLLGCFAGIFTWLYIDRFIPNLQQEIYQNYIELYPENRPIFHSEKAAIQSQKCGHIFLYFLGFGLCFAALYYFLQDELFTLWLAITLSLIFVISWLDWHYQLISPTPCQFFSSSSANTFFRSSARFNSPSSVKIDLPKCSAI